VVGVNDLLYVALVCLCVTENWNGDLVGLVNIKCNRMNYDLYSNFGHLHIINTGLGRHIERVQTNHSQY